MPFLFKLTKRLASSRALAVVVIGIAACTAGDRAATDPVIDDSLQSNSSTTVASVSLSPSTAAGSLGQSAQFTATAHNSSGGTVNGGIITWTSTDSTIVAVSSTGMGVAVGVGQATVVATIGGVKGTAPATVSGDAIAAIALSPNSASGTAGQQQKLVATLTDAAGTALSGRRVLWTSSNPAVATVDSTGLATGVGAGSATITATSAGKAASASITVTGTQPVTNPSAVTDLAIASIADTTATLSFTQVSDGAGNPAAYEIRYAVAPIAWGTASLVTRGTCTSPFATTTVGAKLTCSINGLSPSTAYNFEIVAYRGTLNINAVFGALANPVAASTTASTPVQPAVASITVSPGTASGSVGQSAQFSATAKDANGNVLSGQTIVWSSTNTAVVTVNSTGYGTAVGAGSAAIVATAGGKSGQSQVTVTGGTVLQTVGQVVLSPASVSVPVGGTQQVAPTLTSTLGTVLTGMPVTWSSSNTSVATVNSNGMVTGVASGSATITATSGGVSGSSPVAVTSAPVSTTSEPMPGTGTMIWQDALNATTDAAILAPYSLMTGNNAMHADPTAGPNGSGALRIDWNKSTTCNDDWSGIERSIPGAPTEIYIQFWVRYTPGFLFDWVHTNTGPCTGVAKKLFLVWSGNSNDNRFMYVMENLNLSASSDYESAIGAPRVENTANPMSSAQYGDGNWHRVTFHIKQSSTTTSTDGFLYGWIDGVERWAKPNWASGSTGGWVDFKFPSTFNSGSPANQSEWMANLAIWRP